MVLSVVGGNACYSASVIRPIHTCILTYHYDCVYSELDRTLAGVPKYTKLSLTIL